MGNSWAVVATVDEPTPLVAAFVAHHLNEGAREVHLFLDKPDPEAAGLLRAMTGCRLARCNQAHWAEHNKGRRPNLHTRRQIINANIAYQRCDADWLLHCDADEFVRDGKALRHELAAIPDDHVHLRLTVAERVMPSDVAQVALFDGMFRLPVRQDQHRLEPIYHPHGAYLDRGLTGHPTGKALARVGRGLQLGIHQPAGEIPALHIKSTRILHFDGLTEFHYLLKLLRRAHEKDLPGPPRHKPGRMAQLSAMKAHAGDSAFFRALATGLKTLRPEQLAALSAMNAIEPRPFAPNLGGMQLDLSVASFDAALRARQAEFLQAIGFQG